MVKLREEKGKLVEDKGLRVVSVAINMELIAYSTS
jgi:hypothetical protein